MRRYFAGIWMGVLLILSACGSNDQAGTGGGEKEADESEERPMEYQVTLGNALSDTLEGLANFGRVQDPQTGDELFVIRLSTGFDFAGGIVISRRDTTLPTPGDYDLALAADSAAAVPDDKFFIIYREGMLWDLRSESGTLTFSIVSDSLIEGRFDATLQGEIADRGRELTEGEVHAVGRFRAGPGMTGYVIGL